MDEECLFWDNQEFMKQMGLASKSDGTVMSAAPQGDARRRHLLPLIRGRS